MRSTLDKLISWTGLILAVVLFVAAGLLGWASVFIGDQVDQQLSDQKIVMPSEETLDAEVEEGRLPKEDADVMKEYADSEMDTGPEAKAYADHYILKHMEGATGGLTYSELGDPQRAACTEDPEGEECATLTGQRDTAFKGSTLRGLLLYGYAFATMGTIAGIAAIGAAVAGVVMLLLGLLGLRHAKQVSTTSTV